ncbi:MAG: hypothetical protein AAB291_04135 [Chloroflexota bacterium]
MAIRFGGSGSGAYIGCGAFLVILGLLLLSPLIDWLTTALGWISIALGGVAVVVGILYWLFGRSDRNC